MSEEKRGGWSSYTCPSRKVEWEFPPCMETLLRTSLPPSDGMRSMNGWWGGGGLREGRPHHHSVCSLGPRHSHPSKIECPNSHSCDLPARMLICVWRVRRGPCFLGAGIRGQISEPHSIDTARGPCSHSEPAFGLERAETDEGSSSGCCFICFQTSTKPLSFHGQKALESSMY